MNNLAEVVMFSGTINVIYDLPYPPGFDSKNSIVTSTNIGANGAAFYIMKILDGLDKFVVRGFQTNAPEYRFLIIFLKTNSRTGF